ncbi:unnamed protein product [Arctia plantaginis]|uniref:Uncharacterized protein n=1 Tax=Arctia plantaginis TaxID=874455 RepID=A0A8S1BHA9_ARCPL|nr:unnamed protein product [Arctia plantaginis]
MELVGIAKRKIIPSHLQPDDDHELSKNSSSFDKLLMDIPTQDIVIEATGEDSTKRKSPGGDGSVAKRRTGSVSKLDIMKNE